MERASLIASFAARWLALALLAPIAGWLGCASTPGDPSATATKSAAATATETESAPPLRIGVHAKLPPIVFRQANSLAGAEVDLGRQLAQHLGRQPDFVVLAWEDLMPALLDGRIDIIMSGMSITDARRTRVEFCDPWLRAGQSALVRRSEFGTLRFGLVTGSYRIGTQKATTGEIFVDRNLSSARRTQLSSPEAGARALTAKRIDAFIHDLPINLWLASENEASGLAVLDLLFTDEYLAWAVRRDDAELRSAANQFVARIKSDGTLEGIVRRWLPGYLDRSAQR